MHQEGSDTSWDSHSSQNTQPLEMTEKGQSSIDRDTNVKDAAYETTIPGHSSPSFSSFGHYSESLIDTETATNMKHSTQSDNENAKKPSQVAELWAANHSLTQRLHHKIEDKPPHSFPTKENPTGTIQSAEKNIQSQKMEQSSESNDADSDFSLGDSFDLSPSRNESVLQSSNSKAKHRSRPSIKESEASRKLRLDEEGIDMTVKTEPKPKPKPKPKQTQKSQWMEKEAKSTSGQLLSMKLVPDSDDRSCDVDVTTDKDHTTVKLNTAKHRHEEKQQLSPTQIPSSFEQAEDVLNQRKSLMRAEEQKVREHDTIINQLRLELATLQSKAEHLQSVNTSLENQNEQQANSILSNEQRISELVLVNTRLTTDLQVSEQTVTALKNDNTSLNTELAKVSEVIASKEAEAATLLNRLNRRENDIKHFEKLIEEYQDNKKQLMIENERIKGQLVTTEMQLQMQQQNDKGKSGSVSQESANKSHLDKVLDQRVQAAFEESRKQVLESSKQELAFLKDRLHRAEEDIGERAKKESNLQHAVDELRDEKFSLELRIRELENELQQSKQQSHFHVKRPLDEIEPQKEQQPNKEQATLHMSGHISEYYPDNSNFSEDDSVLISMADGNRALLHDSHQLRHLLRKQAKIRLEAEERARQLRLMLTSMQSREANQSLNDSFMDGSCVVRISNEEAQELLKRLQEKLSNLEIRYQKMNNHCTDMEYNNIELEAKLRELQTENRTLGTRSSAAEAQAQELQHQCLSKDSELSRLHQQLASIEAELDSEQTALSTTQRKADRMTQQLEELSEQLQVTQDDLAAYKEICDENDKLRRQLEKEIETLSTNNRKWEDSLASSQQQLVAQTNTNSHLRQKLEAAEAAVEEATAQFGKKEKVQQEQIDRLIRQIAQTRGDLEVANTRVTALNNELEASERAHQQSKGRLQDSYTQIQELKLDKRDLEEELRNEQNKRNVLSDQLLGMKKQIDNLQQSGAEQRTVYNEEHMTLTQEVNELRDKLSSEKEDKAQLQAQKEEASAEVAVVTRKLQVAQEELSEVQKMLDAKEEALNAKKRSLVDATKEIARLKSVEETLRKESNFISKERDRLQELLDTEKNHAGASLKAVHDERQGLQQQLALMKEKLIEQQHASEQQTTMLQVQVEELSRQLVIKSKEIDRLEQDLQDTTIVDNLRKDLILCTSQKKVAEEQAMRANEQASQLEIRVQSLQREMVETQRLETDLRKELGDITDHRNSLQKELQQAHALQEQHVQVQCQKRDLEAVQRRTEAALSQETSARERAEERSRALEEALDRVQQQRTTAESLMSEMQSKLNTASTAREQAESARDEALSKADELRRLWEAEVQSRNALGMKILGMEDAAEDWNKQAEKERQRTRQALEKKRSAEAKLEAVFQRNESLQRKIGRLEGELRKARETVTAYERGGLRAPSTDAEVQVVRQQAQQEIDHLRQQFQHLKDTHSRLEESKLTLMRKHSETIAAEKKEYDNLKQKMQELEENHAKLLHSLNHDYVPRESYEGYRSKIDQQAEVALREKIRDINVALEHDAAVRDALGAHERLEFEKTLQRLRRQVAMMKEQHAKQVVGSNPRRERVLSTNGRADSDVEYTKRRGLRDPQHTQAPIRQVAGSDIIFVDAIMFCNELCNFKLSLN